MRPVCHSSAFDGVREAAMRTGVSGSGIGWRSHRITQPRRPVRLDLGWVLAGLAVLAITGAVLGWWR